ncbi:hypothetical protein SNE40_002049 [Patella caerulea]|uniref:BTB domain-containing protein n=1 Tax=Patella caerulea TaxID=87958 RepID=A0AAN8Q2H1_PATCE
MALLNTPEIGRRHSLFSNPDRHITDSSSLGVLRGPSLEDYDIDDPNEPSTLTLNIGGKIFKTYAQTLSKLRSVKIDEICSRARKSELFFDRNPEVFAAILDYCRYSELHLPRNVCVLVCRKELAFWGVNESLISDCCKKYLMDCTNEIQLQESLYAEFIRLRPKKACDAKNTRERIYNLLHHPETSTAAKVWAAFYYILVLVSVGSIFLSTVPQCRVPVSSEQLPPFYQSDHDHDNHSLSKRSLDDDPGGVPVVNLTHFTHPIFSAVYSSDYILQQMETNSKIRMMVTTKVVPALEFLDMVCMIYFTLEFIARVITVPSRLRMFMHFFTWCDLMYLIPVWILWIGQLIDPSFWRAPENITYFVFLEFLIVARVLALFRVANQYKALRILILSMKASLGEILLLLVFVMLAMIVYSSLIYCVEIFIVGSMDNMFEGLWWSIITMTTVGYGDMVPKSGMGYLVACICALTGIILIGMPVPIITSNFHKYYGFRNTREEVAQPSPSQETNVVSPTRNEPD